MAWTVLWSSGSTLMRRTSPCTRIIGGSPADRCRSEALFLTLNASNWVMSTEFAPSFGTLAAIMTTIENKLQQIHERIASACAQAGRASGSVQLLSVSKTDRKSTRLNSSHLVISYAVFCLKKKKIL